MMILGLIANFLMIILGFYFAQFLIFNICIGKNLTANLKKYLLLSLVIGTVEAILWSIVPHVIIFQIISIVILGIILAKINDLDIKVSIITFLTIILGFQISNMVLLAGFEWILQFEIAKYLYWILPFVDDILGVLISMFFAKRASISLYSYWERNKLLWIYLVDTYVFVSILNPSLFDYTQLSFWRMVEVIILVTGVGVANVWMYKTIDYEFEEKKRLEIDRAYSSVINNLIDEFRANQHEYKNHLNTLSAMVHLNNENSSLELTKMVDDYIEEIGRNDKYSKLMYVDNIIVKAIVYNNISRFEHLGINFVYDIKSNLRGIAVQETDLSILLNNLLNNAMEATKGIEFKNVRLSIYENDGKFIIKSENTVEDEIIDYAKIFEKKESSKGENRGFGLYNVKNIVERYKGEIEISIENGYFILVTSFNIKV